jgi:protein TonB
LRNTTLSDPIKPTHRIAVIAGLVVLLHLAALWALQGGLLRRAQEVVVPVQVLSVRIAPKVPLAQSATPPAAKPPAAPQRPAAVQAAAVAHRPAPTPTWTPTPSAQPVAISDATPVAAHSTGTPVDSGAAQSAPSAATVAAPASTGPAQAAPTATKVELPSKDADYLNNPKAPYPLMSRRLGEQGRVLVKVFIEVDGTPNNAEIKTSSGFDRLDRAALASVLQWRYEPGKVGGVAQGMWYVVPVDFLLNESAKNRY